MLSWWFWGPLFVLSGCWYFAEPFFLLFHILQEQRDTDPLLPLVEPPPPEHPAES